MQYGKDYIATMKELYEQARAVAFASAADTASRKYGMPILKLPMELIRSIAASDATVVAALDAWQKAVIANEDTIKPDDSWSGHILNGYTDDHGAPMSIGTALQEIGTRLSNAEQTLLSIVRAVSSDHSDDRAFWMGSVLETATLVRVEAGASLTMLGDVVLVSKLQSKHESIRSKQDQAKILRDDARSLIDLAKAHLGMF